jgi:predicted hydrocarbon binding protein
MFKEERKESNFNWAMLGNIKEGRPNLGPTTSVAVYRLMQFTLRDVLIREVGVVKANEIFYDAGEAAGRAFYRNVVTKKDSLNDYITNLQNLLKELKIGILKVESADREKLTFTIAVAEDLDCSGLPICDEEICTFDEGFISGLLSEFSGRKFITKEVDCWCSGGRVCRFEARAVI